MRNEPIARPIVFPWSMASSGARDLARALGALRVHPHGRYRPRPSDTVIGWGASQAPSWRAPILNDPSAVALAVDKLATFQALSRVGVALPPWTESIEEARNWLSATGRVLKVRVFCRTKLRGHSGDGIVVASTPSELVSARLFTRYVPKSAEYRVHVFADRVLDVQEKRRRNGAESSLIRSVHNGYVFCRTNVRVPDSVISESITAVRTLGLDFGAVDVIVSKRDGKAIVLEVNTAPGLEGQTLSAYVLAFRRLMETKKSGRV